jgi:acyl dehydratase
MSRGSRGGIGDQLTGALEELRASVGDVRRTEIGAITPLAARRFAVACGEIDPVFFDDVAANEAGWSGTPLPPLLLSSTRSWTSGPTRDELNEDGMLRTDVGYPSDRSMRALGGGQSLRFHADAVAGVALVTEAEVTGANTKAGRSGDLLVVELERRFVTAEGELLVTCEETRIFR